MSRIKTIMLFYVLIKKPCVIILAHWYVNFHALPCRDSNQTHIWGNMQNLVRYNKKRDPFTEAYFVLNRNNRQGSLEVPSPTIKAWFLPIFSISYIKLQRDTLQLTE